MAALSATNQALLNRYAGALAYKIKLGDIIADALAVTAAEITAIGDGKILVGAASTGIATARTVSGDITISNTGVSAIGADKVLGTMIADDQIDSEHIAAGAIDAEHLAAGALDRSDADAGTLYDSFATPFLHVDDATTAAAPTGTGGDVNWLIGGQEVYSQTVIGTQTDVSYAWTEADRLEISQDDEDNDGSEINLGITSNSKFAKTVGTDNFFIEARVEVADVSSQDEVIVGFRKAEAHQADYNNYDEAVFMNINAGGIYVGNIINGGATVETDTTDAITDGQFAKLRVEVDDVQGLASAITLANACKAAYNLHFADTAEHTGTEVGTAVAAADATNLATLITLTTELLSDYDTDHDTDAENASPTYHVAQEGGDASLASAVAPTDLAECINRLNDFKAKYNTHDADGTAHTTGSTHLVTATDASRVFFTLGANSTTLAAPSTTDQFYLDDGEVVVPFIRVLNAGGSAGKVYLQELKIGNV